MEFHLRLAGRQPDLAALEGAITAVDPAAVVDMDTGQQVLRVNTLVDAAQLVALAGQAGCVVAPEEVMQLPSVCCGGCSG